MLDCLFKSTVPRQERETLLISVAATLFPESLLNQEDWQGVRI
jgi:hypothetical protein